MATEKKSILNRLYIVFVFSTLFFIIIVAKLFYIQYSEEGDHYRSISAERTVKNDTIYANRGNVYADDGSLLATSMSRYEIRMDAFTVDAEVFEEHIKGLSVELSKMFGNSSAYYVNRIRAARRNKNRYLFIARNIGYLDYQKIKKFPIFKLGVYKGGFIAEQSTRREHPLGKIAERTIGYDDYRGDPGIEGAYKKYLRGKLGWRLKQRIAQGHWKPINDNNEVEPQDGRDIITTINVNIQDIAHHSLLRQLEYYDAEHGCVVVMETKTGAIKAISNLGRTSDGKFYEKLNYAIGESHEPGSAFKLMSMVAALEAKVIDSSTIVDTGEGKYRMHGRYIHDSKRGGYGEISAARALEVSSNIAFARLIDENFSENPNEFIDALKKMHLDKKLNLAIKKGEGMPEIPAPGDKKWSKNALPSIAYGYNLSLTPLQILTFYNAIANNGEMVRPRLVKEIRFWDEKVEVYGKEIIDPKICSDQTIDKVQEMLKNVVVRGTAESLYSENFSMAGKTGTARTEYWMKDWETNRRYISSFTGYFPAENPKYSCIVVIHKPSAGKGYYGADVSGPVFKDIAHKIYRDAPILEEIQNKEPQFALLDTAFEAYYKSSQSSIGKMPNLMGMSGMDAISLLENLGLKVEFVGNGSVKKQSVKSGNEIVKGGIVILELS